jgi:hypothetical protein
MYKVVSKDFKTSSEKMFFVSFDNGRTELYACKFKDGKYLIIEHSISQIEDHILKEVGSAHELEDAFVLEVLKRTQSYASQFSCWLA